ncbi:MAG: ribose 5-phosphate isomerase B [Gemmatimonadota bacterium]|nr:ribose 5-phosphate isomerase B [Gemmatimonadota bacterium]
MAEKVPVGSDHAGYEIKGEIIAYLEELGYEPEDVGTNSTKSVDYPDYARIVAGRVSENRREWGVLVCGSGIGMSIAANKFKGVRAALCLDERMAGLARAHNDANILVLAGRFLGQAKAKAILKKWIETDFEHGRHVPRISKIKRMEESGMD